MARPHAAPGRRAPSRASASRAPRSSMVNTPLARATARPTAAVPGTPGGVVDTTTAGTALRAARSCNAAQPTSAVNSSGRSATSGAVTGAVPPATVGQLSRAVTCSTGRNGNATASKAASTPSTVAAERERGGLEPGIGAGATVGLSVIVTAPRVEIITPAITTGPDRPCAPRAGPHAPPRRPHHPALRPATQRSVVAGLKRRPGPVPRAGWTPSGR